MAVMVVCAYLCGYGQGNGDESWKKLYGSTAYLFLEYRTSTEKNRLVESGYITKYYLQSIDREDTVLCNVAITYHTKGKERKLIRNDVVVEPNGTVPFLVDAETIESFSVDLVTVRFHSRP
jgi:hypothetical protein